MMNSMMRFAIALSSFIVISCANAPKRPVGFVKAINALATKPYALTFNLETDFDNNLKLLPDANGERVEVSLEALHKHWCLDTPSKEDLVRYALQWKERYLELEEKCE